jgi:hypothetical protein
MKLPFFQFFILRNYDLIWNCLRFRKLYSRRRHLDTLFLIDVLKGKTNFDSTVFVSTSK